jgi:hypothetical protein
MTAHCYSSGRGLKPDDSLTGRPHFPCHTGKNPFGAQNRRNSSQIDPCNQVLTGSFPMRLAGKKFSLPDRRQGNGRESKKGDDLGGLVPILPRRIRFDRDRTMARVRTAPSLRPKTVQLVPRGEAGAFPRRECCETTGSSRRRHSATLAQIMRVNLDTKMAGSPSPRRRRRSGLFARLHRLYQRK